MDEGQEASRLGKDLAQLRMNLHLLEEDLRAVESHNRKEVLARQEENKLVGLRKEELTALKGRINNLLREEKMKLRELNVSLVRAEASLLTHNKGISDSESKRKRAESTSFDVHREYLEKSMRHHSVAKTEDIRVQDAHRRLKLESKVKNMQNAVKIKMYEVATQQASKGHQLLRRVMTGKRIEKEKKQTKKVLKGAEYLLNYSVDIEKVIKSNIDIANELKKHYERLSDLQGLHSSKASQIQDESMNSLPQVTGKLNFANQHHTVIPAQTSPGLNPLQTMPVLPQSPPSSVTEPYHQLPAVYGASSYHRYHLDNSASRNNSMHRKGPNYVESLAPPKKSAAVSWKKTYTGSEGETSAERSRGSQGIRSARFSELSSLNPAPSPAMHYTAPHVAHPSQSPLHPTHSQHSVHRPLALVPSISTSKHVGVLTSPVPTNTNNSVPKQKGLSPRAIVPIEAGSSGEHEWRETHTRGSGQEGRETDIHIQHGETPGEVLRVIQEKNLREALMMGVKGLDPSRARRDERQNEVQRIQSGDSLDQAREQARVGNELAKALRMMAGMK